MEETSKNNKTVQLDIAAVISRFTDDEISRIAREQVNLSADCFGQYDYTSGKQEGFEDGMIYLRDVILNGI